MTEPTRPDPRSSPSPLLRFVVVASVLVVGLTLAVVNLLVDDGVRYQQVLQAVEERR